MSSNAPPWKCLISPTLPANERTDLIMAIFSDRDEVEMFKYLSVKDSQALIDVIDEVSTRTLLLPQIPLKFLLARHWIASLRQSAGGACTLRIGSVAAKPCFQSHFGFHFAMIQ